MKKTNFLETLVLSTSIHLAVAVGASFFHHEPIHPSPTTTYELEIVESKKSEGDSHLPQEEGIASSQPKKVLNLHLPLELKKISNLKERNKTNITKKINELTKEYLLKRKILCSK